MINADKKGEGLYNVADCKGQYVKRVKVCTHCNAGKIDVWGAPYNGEACTHCNGKGAAKIQSKVYQVECFRHDLKRWQLVSFDDMNQCVYVKPGTKVWAGFEY